MKTLHLPVGRVKRDVLATPPSATLPSFVSKSYFGRLRTPFASVGSSDYVAKERAPHDAAEILWAAKVLMVERGRCVAIKLDAGHQVKVGVMDLGGKIVWLCAQHLVLEPGFKVWRTQNRWASKPA